MTTLNATSPATDDASLLALVVAAVESAGLAVRARFGADTRPTGRRDIGALIAANDAVSLAMLRPALLRCGPTMKAAPAACPMANGGSSIRSRARSTMSMDCRTGA